MRTSSAKAKGRRLQDYVAKELSKLEIKEEITGIAMATWVFDPGDFKPAIMGESGTDVVMSPYAKKHVPFDIECKNVEKINIWGSLKQAEANTQEGRIPLLVFKRNRSKVYAVLPFEDLLELL